MGKKQREEVAVTTYYYTVSNCWSLSLSCISVILISDHDMQSQGCPFSL
jgi:hypothetical protein